MKNQKSLPDVPAHIILKKRREELGLTQKQVSNISSIDIRLYQRFESGERKISNTSFRIGMAVADVLELDAHKLVSNIGVDEYLKEKREFERLDNRDDKED